MSSPSPQPASVLKLAVLPLIGFASAAALGYVALFTPSQQALYSAAYTSGCTVPARKQLPTDITRGVLPQIDNALCVLLPFFKQLIADRASIAGGALIFSTLLPILMRQCYLASSPNTRSFFLGPLAVVLVHLIGRMTGIGFALASVGLLFQALGSYQQMQRSSESLPVVPTPAGSVYWSNLLLSIITVLLFSVSTLESSGAKWTLASVALLAYPAFLSLALLLATAGVKTTKDERQGRTALLEYSAEQVSYAFERKWSYYRKAALGSMAAYWFGLVRLGWAWQEGTLRFSGLPLFLFADYIGTVVYIILAIRIERLTIRSSAPTHPLTGQPRSRLSLDCQKAITLAPAGNPQLERGTWQPLVAGILCGPGMAAALGWREAAAVQGAKKN
ncbi:hypothetical protein BCV69DRAFT_96227 [Microstroma glucosiphilum]|uniref:Uncharacterized protein n=1 Tax=Pseudomicrostroma glucosiphilum TaxID=1684307 RepID=A0A316UD30_9BASI|nr:hypothetical protein BCV69DRAFT_96227 [Pseudomicrostroma glucosiphilum]PWN22744.1 hypothetical protein BCV69DRAFT_96227 [Pseudomicrostroma glucosiphilum]